MTYAELTRRLGNSSWAAPREFESRIFGFPGRQRPRHHVVPTVSACDPVLTELLRPRLASKVAAAHREHGQSVSPAETEAIQQITAALGPTGS